MRLHMHVMVKLIVVLSFLFGACATHEKTPPQVVRTYPIDSLNALLMANVKDKRIVMIADGGHGHGYYMEKVTSFLGRWIRESTLPPVDSRTPSSLILFLEIDQPHEQDLNGYFASGNLDPLLARRLDGGIKWGEAAFTADDLRFYHELRDIRIEIDRRNQDRPRNKLELKIVGAEEEPPFTYEEKLTTSPDKFEKMTFLYFAEKRDRLSSMRIKRTLDQNPRARGLVFYGESHLARAREDKSAVVRLGRSSSSIPPLYEYYLAHYLDSIFGRDKVAVFKYGLARGGNDISKSGSLVERFRPQKEAADYVICLDKPQPSPCPIRFLRSSTVLNTLLQAMNNYNRGQAKVDQRLAVLYGWQLYLQFLHTYLYADPSHRAEIDSISDLLTTGGYRSIPEVARIADGLIRSFDAVENVERMNTWLTREGLPDSSLYVPMVRGILRGLPSTTGRFRWTGLSLPPELSKYTLSSAEEQAFATREKELIQYSLINLLWLATPAEKEKAARALRKITGQRFTEAIDWSTWWEAKFDSN
jgi:hypothetical protein